MPDEYEFKSIKSSGVYLMGYPCREYKGNFGSAAAEGGWLLRFLVTVSPIDSLDGSLPLGRLMAGKNSAE
jgi:hypothetical protein